MSLDTKELKTITMLYVEDDDTIRKQTYTLFNQLFKKIYIANDGVKGVELFLQYKNEIEIIVTDINMPNMNGLDMIKEINKANKNIPVIVTTAYTDSQYLLDAIDLNIDKYIAKPIQVRELTISIVNLVVKYRRLNNIELLAKNLVQKTNKDEKTNSKLQNTVEYQAQEIKYYKTIIDNFVLFCQTDTKGDIIKASTKFINYFGYNKDDISKINISQLKCEMCQGESFQQLMLRAIHTKKTIVSSHTFIANSNRVDLNITMTPNYDQNSLVTGYTFYLDI